MATGATSPLRREVQFSDLSISFTPHPVTGKPATRKNAAAIEGALKNLILTNRFERPYEPTFGSDIRNRLFENFDPVEAVNIEEDIKLAISNHEPRVNVNEVRVIGSPDDNVIKVYISFFIINQAQPEELQLNIERIR